MTSIKDVFIIEGLDQKIREKILPVAKEIKAELVYLLKQEPQMSEMTERMIESIDGIVTECRLQGNKFKMRKEYEELLRDATTIRKAAGFKLLTKPGGKPLPGMRVGAGDTGNNVKPPDEKSVVLLLSLVKELSDLIQEAFGVKKLAVK